VNKHAPRHRLVRPSRRHLLIPAVLAIIAACVTALVAPGHNTRASAATTSASGPRVFAYYYLWWSSAHWKSSLGPNYPIHSSRLPLPATIGADGCTTHSRYAGNKLTDVPSRIYSQDDPGQTESDVRQAAAAGLAGFAVNWAGTGAAKQTPTSNPYSRRLQLLVNAVHKVNREGIHFSLWLSYKASASIRSTSYIVNDLAYFVARYGKDSAFDRARSAKPTVIWQGSRKYSASTLQTISSKFRSRLRILGDENKWSASRARYLDGDAYYWSSQNPYTNPQSFSQLRTLANSVRATGRNPDGSGKVWIAPLNPGYNKKLAGGSTCVPRRNGQTIRTVYAGNRASRPLDFGLISWNEITEGSYVDPMTRYGSQDLKALKPLLAR
jgi:membrane-bound inhibitor of C-type lysozyme